MGVDQVKAWQYCINKRSTLEDRIALQWLKEFVCASSTDSLRNAVAKKYSMMGKPSGDGIMYLFRTLFEMFQISKEINLAMISFIEYFKKKDIATFS